MCQEIPRVVCSATTTAQDKALDWVEIFLPTNFSEDGFSDYSKWQGDAAKTQPKVKSVEGLSCDVEDRSRSVSKIWELELCYIWIDPSRFWICVWLCHVLPKIDHDGGGMHLSELWSASTHHMARSYGAYHWRMFLPRQLVFLTLSTIINPKRRAFHNIYAPHFSLSWRDEKESLSGSYCDIHLHSRCLAVSVGLPG